MSDEDDTRKIKTDPPNAVGKGIVKVTLPDGTTMEFDPDAEPPEGYHERKVCLAFGHEAKGYYVGLPPRQQNVPLIFRIQNDGNPGPRGAAVRLCARCGVFFVPLDELETA